MEKNEIINKARELGEVIADVEIDELGNIGIFVEDVCDSNFEEFEVWLEENAINYAESFCFVDDAYDFGDFMVYVRDVNSDNF